MFPHLRSSRHCALLDHVFDELSLCFSFLPQTQLSSCLNRVIMHTLQLLRGSVATINHLSTSARTVKTIP